MPRTLIADKQALRLYLLNDSIHLLTFTQLTGANHWLGFAIYSIRRKLSNSNLKKGK